MVKDDDVSSFCQENPAPSYYRENEYIKVQYQEEEFDEEDYSKTTVPSFAGMGQ